MALTKKQIEEAKARLHGENVQKIAHNKPSILTWLLRSFIVFVSYCTFAIAYNTIQPPDKRINFLSINDLIASLPIEQPTVTKKINPEKEVESKPKKELKSNTEEEWLAMTLEIVNEQDITWYVPKIESVEYVQMSGTCNIKFKEAPGRYLEEGFFYDNEISQLDAWKKLQFKKLNSCLQEEQEYNINRLNDYFDELFEYRLIGAAESAKDRYKKAMAINGEIPAALEFMYKEFNNVANETYYNNIKGWEDFINNKVMPALKEGRSIDRSLAAEREAKCRNSPVVSGDCISYEIDEANRPGGYNNPICTNCNQGSELEQFARSVNRAANQYIKEPQRRQAERQARSISNFVQMTEIRDRLYADDRYERGNNFHLKSKEHRPISLKPNSSTPPIKEFKEDRTSCPLAAHEYQEKTACWCLKTGTRCKTVLK